MKQRKEKNKNKQKMLFQQEKQKEKLAANEVAFCVWKEKKTLCTMYKTWVDYFSVVATLEGITEFKLN